MNVIKRTSCAVIVAATFTALVFVPGCIFAFLFLMPLLAAFA